jgi:integrase
MRLRRDWEAACLAAKIQDFHFHDLRHQAATDLLTMGAGLNDARDFLRHKSATMTLRYAHLIEERRTWTARLLDGLEGRLKKGTKTGTSSEAIP